MPSCHKSETHRLHTRSLTRLRKAEEIASKNRIALVVDAVILAVLVFGALWLLVRTILHAIPVCIWATNQMKEIFGLDKANPNSAFRLITTSVIDKKGLESAVVELLKEPEKSSDVVIVYLAQ